MENVDFKYGLRQNLPTECAEGTYYQCTDTGELFLGTADGTIQIIGKATNEKQPNNEIWYVTTDGNVITPYSTATFGANIVSNTYSNGKGVIKFDADVTMLGSHAFDGCSNLVTMSIPTTVTNIKSYAFYNCTGLVQVDIPDTVTTLEGYIFYKCTSLKYVNVGIGVTLLPTYMCHTCTSLVRVNVPDSITRINSYCFYGCSKLQRFTIPNSVTTIETYAFRNTSLVEVDIPNSVTTIGTYAFANCSKLRKVTIGLGVTSIASYAFSSSGRIKQIYCNAVSIPSLGSTGVFLLALSAGKIYVPISLYESYLSATNWSAYAQYITAYVEPSMLKTINGNSILGSGDITISGGSSGSSAYSEVSHGTADTTFELTPNTFHVWDEVTELDLSLGAETAGVANEYLFQFTSGSTATTLTLPEDIKWANDDAPAIETNKIYQISILKGLGSVLEWDNATEMTFTINNTPYQYLSGMSWSEFINSNYNPLIYTNKMFIVGDYGPSYALNVYSEDDIEYSSIMTEDYYSIDITDKIQPINYISE